MLKPIKLFLILVTIYSISSAQNGIVRSYYPGGRLKSEVSFTNDILDGPSITYYPNGNIKSEKNYSRGILNGYQRKFYEDGLIREEYFVRDGIIDGNLRKYYDNGGLAELVVYSDGIQIQNSIFAYDSLYVAPINAYKIGNRQQELLDKKKQELICDVEVCPVPVGSLQAIQNNLIYPEHALLYGLEGTVTLIASISDNGNVISTEVIKHLGLGCDEAAQEAVKKTQFIPGQNHNRAVESRVTLNIDFKIFERAFVQYQNNLQDKTIVEKVNDKLDEKEVKAPLSQTVVINCDLEECPYPVGGLKSINDNLEIPGIAKRLKLKGEIIIEALIDKFGNVQNTEVKRGIGYGCDDSVESAIMRTKFNPGRKNGKETDTKVTIIFPFSYE